MSDHASLYRLLAALGFGEPSLNQEGLPSIAWVETRIGVAQPGDLCPEDWDVLPLGEQLLALAKFCDELLSLRAYQQSPALPRSASTRTFSAPSIPVPDTLSFHALYRLLAGLGFEEPVLNGEGAPAISWPATMTGVTAPGDRVSGQWETVQIGPEFNELARVALLLTRYQLRLSGSSATRRISSDEQKLLDAVLRRGLPPPDRNYKVVDDEGKFRGVIDFAWDELEGVGVRVAVELDGWHWHAGADLRDALATLANDHKDVATVVHKETRSRVARDAAKRRVLSRRGWIVMQVTDDEVRRPGGAEQVADEIRATVARRFYEAKQRDVTEPPVMSAERLN